MNQDLEVLQYALIDVMLEIKNEKDESKRERLEAHKQYLTELYDELQNKIIEGIVQRYGLHVS